MCTTNILSQIITWKRRREVLPVAVSCIAFSMIAHIFVKFIPILIKGAINLRLVLNHQIICSSSLENGPYAICGQCSPRPACELTQSCQELPFCSSDIETISDLIAYRQFLTRLRIWHNTRFWMTRVIKNHCNYQIRLWFILQSIIDFLIAGFIVNIVKMKL